MGPNDPKTLPPGGPAGPSDQAPAETPATEPTQAQPKETSKEPDYVTKDDLKQFGDSLAKRINMASRDRTNKIETQVKAIVAQLEKAGAPPSPEVTQKLREQVAEALEDDGEPAPEAPAGATDKTDNPVFDWTMEAYRTEGIEILATDPEFAAIQAALSDPTGTMYKYQKVVMGAIETKRQRTTSRQETADARVIGGGQPATSQARLTPEQKLSLGLQGKTWPTESGKA